MALPARLTAIGRLGFRSRAYARHVYQKIAALTIGAAFVSPAGRRLRRLAARFRTPTPQPDVRAALVAHLFYLDLLPEVLDCRAMLPNGAKLHLTVPTDRVEQVRRLVWDIPDVIIHPCENRGRDIAPFIALLNAGVFDAYDAVLKLHTKRSPHLLDGEIRRKLLFTMLAGERNATWRTLVTFEKPDTGIVGWRDCYREAPPYWMGNEARVRMITAQMCAPKEAVRLGFFEGSMFWFRPAALARLRQLRLSIEDFEPEERQLDGTLHHAIERCFTIAARADDFLVRDLDGRVLE
ncbi:rhamnan synthesis F family protein [Bosea sp. RAF48]|uniref:rhamnan synthesis F family protein n=1 Tax=Bosea sp. RAF48 TaxID=3237480 RepID=UPI003F92C013